MNYSELKELEKRLVQAENIFVDSRHYSPKSQQIWSDLQGLLQRVVTERLRLETREAKTTEIEDVGESPIRAEDRETRPIRETA